MFPCKGGLLERGVIFERGGGPNREFGVQIWVIFLLKSARIKAGILEQGVFGQLFQPVKNLSGAI